MKNTSQLNSQEVGKKMRVWRFDALIKQWGEVRQIYVVSNSQATAQQEFQKFWPSAKIQNLQEYMPVDLIASDIVIDILSSPGAKAHYDFMAGRAKGLPQGVAPIDKKDDPVDFSEVNKWEF